MTTKEHDEAIRELTRVLMILGVTWNPKYLARGLVDKGYVLAGATKKGTWKYYSHTMMECSVCGRHTTKHKYKYCPHCGAEMDEEVANG